MLLRAGVLALLAFGVWSSTTAAGGSTTIKAAYNADLKTPLVAGKGIKRGLLGTVVRSDNGKKQVTYAGHPLYRYAGGVSGPPDTKPGDVYGQGAVSIWFVLSPSGKVFKKGR